MNIGDNAPEFTLPDKDGKMISLSDFAGKNVVLYFYPKDNTPGCTRQACAFAANFAEFQKRDIVVIGISRDSSESHRKFAEKHGLPFILLSDPERSRNKHADRYRNGLPVQDRNSDRSLPAYSQQ